MVLSRYLIWTTSLDHLPPKKPASHGYIRLQRRFAKKLFEWTDKGTPVRVAGDVHRYYDHGVAGGDYTKDEDGYSTIEVY